LWHREAVRHQYPHCWRCHNPVIFLATSQWFISLDGVRLPVPSLGEGTPDGRTLREAALDAIDNQVRWIPSWSHDRMRNMIVSRPDWCISRQRAWGVPIPAVDCAKCGEAIVTPALVEQAASVFERYGAESWYERSSGEFIPEGLACPSCGGTTFEREMNILDVWFDSGSSHEAVLSVRPELTWPADMYFEGSDQHRGWFQSSLLVGLGTRGRPPFHQVLTHGFIVAEDGRKMSKSLGNSIDPKDVIQQSGADILRLWVSMSDYTQEVRLSKEILARVVEAYRKIRNTLRYLVANLYDFDPAVDRVPAAQLEEIDRYILARYAEVGRRMLAAYDEYDYGTIFNQLSTFATVDLSAVYNDISKDRLYTFAAKSAGRRSAQTAMFIMADGLARLMAPILSFTADEVWRFLPGAHGSTGGAPRAEAAEGRDESVHIALFPSRDELASFVDAGLTARWDRLTVIREQVLAEIEPLRKDKQIGSSLQAKVVLSASPSELALLEQHARDLPMLFIVSEVELRPAPTDVETHEEAGPRVTIQRAGGVKCERCWRYVPEVSSDPAWAGLCGRCQDALAETVNQ
ncbi:MAG: class I tRNA ligase family protein, partial [Acidobacteria bacterium]|nr:class I tRNA ligase family protein [Acidobacteriota bacterium]